MPLPFDATMKDLAEQNPRDFLAAFEEVPPGQVSLLNVDLSTVTTSTDIVFSVGDPLTRVTHIDCQVSAKADLHGDLLARHALLYRRYQVPIASRVLLLRREARHRNLDGRVRYETHPDHGIMDFRYEVIELWERPAAQLLTGSLGMLPLAPLGRLTAGVAVEVGLAEVIEALTNRVQQEASTEQTRRLLTAAFVLTGMRVRSAIAVNLFRGARAMQESSTYQWILSQGAIAELKKVLLRVGRQRFGEADAATQATIQAIDDLERLERMSDRLILAGGWQELLETP